MGKSFNDKNKKESRSNGDGFAKTKQKFEKRDRNSIKQRLKDYYR